MNRDEAVVTADACDRTFHGGGSSLLRRAQLRASDLFLRVRTTSVSTHTRTRMVHGQ
jgi:hypothetical protein